MPFALRLLLALVIVTVLAYLGIAHAAVRQRLDLAETENALLQAETRALRQQLEAERILSAAQAAKLHPAPASGSAPAGP